MNEDRVPPPRPTETPATGAPPPPTEPPAQAAVELPPATALTVAVLRDYASFLTLTDGLRIIPTTVVAAFRRVRPDLREFTVPTLAAGLRDTADAMEAAGKARGGDHA